MKEAFRAVFAGFLGVRGRSACEADAKRLTPPAVIAAGLVSALALVLAISFVVTVVTR